jgi:hypothetical protein
MPRAREIMDVWTKEKQKSNRPKRHSLKSLGKWRSREWLSLQENMGLFLRNEVLVVKNDVEK